MLRQAVGTSAHISATHRKNAQLAMHNKRTAADTLVAIATGGSDATNRELLVRHCHSPILRYLVFFVIFVILNHHRHCLILTLILTPYHYHIQEEGVPQALLSLSRALHPLHPALKDAWVSWGKGAVDAAAAVVLSRQPRMTIEAVDHEEQDEDYVETKGYDEVHEHDTFEPRQPHDRMTTASSHHTVRNDEDETKKGTGKSKTYPSTTDRGETKNDAIVARQGLNLEVTTVVIDRMGGLIMAVKNLFDMYRAESGLISRVEAAQMLVDMSLRGGDSLLGTAGTLMDWPTFLMHYVAVCGLTNPSSTDGTFDLPRSTKASVGESLWVPTATGMWCEILPSVCEQLVQAGEHCFVPADTVHPPVIDASTLGLRAPSSYGHHRDSQSPTVPKPTKYSALWVKQDALAEVLMIMGLPASDDSVARAIRAMKPLLPGVSSEMYSFQELVLIHRYHLDRPVGGREHEQRSVDPLKKEGKGKLTGQSEDHQRKKLAESMVDDRSIEGMDSGWELPFRSTLRSLIDAAASLPPWAASKTSVTAIDPAKIAMEFNRLDLNGKGRLSYMYLKTALEIRRVIVDDVTVKRWMKENDRGNKGYVDFSDYQAIYTDAFASSSTGLSEEGDGVRSGRGRIGRETRDSNSAYFDQGTNKPGSRRYGTLEAPPRSLSPGKTDTMMHGSTAPNRPAPPDRERMQLLKRAFDRYDVDGDGAISVDDLQLAFAAQGRPTADPMELITWVRRRDSTGVGLYVTFEDFVTHYNN